MRVDGSAYSKQIYGPVNYPLFGGTIGGERASEGTGEGASLSEALESLVDRLDTTGPVEVRGLRSVSEGVLHAIQDDLANTIGEHWRAELRVLVGD